MICQEPMDNDLTSCFTEGVYSESDDRYRIYCDEQKQTATEFRWPFVED